MIREERRKEGGRTWRDVETALQSRPGWKRKGREWHGPCAVDGVGEDGCWFKQGDKTPVAGGCRKCSPGGRLSNEQFREHLDAVCGERERTGGFPGGPRSRTRQIVHAEPDPDTFAQGAPAQAWNRAADWRKTPGDAYLRSRGIVLIDSRVDHLRWLPEWLAGDVRLSSPDDEDDIRLALPDGADGALLYRFTAPDESLDDPAAAVQVEPVAGDGKPLPLWNCKRPTLTGSSFADGTRVFRARAEVRSGAGVHLCEGPIDALALLSLWENGKGINLAHGAVVGAAGTSGVRLAACGADGPITAWPDGDKPGRQAAGRLMGEAIRAGRRIDVRWDSAGDGRDMGDMAKDEVGG